MRKHFATLFLLISIQAFSQENYWQQRMECEMEIDFDHTKHQFSGTQEYTYFNNSPDTLFKVYYHLYFNAFQPGSMMDVRSRTIEDPDARVGDRISSLDEASQGYLRVMNLQQDGEKLDFTEVGTILEVKLKEPIRPGKKATFEMEFEGQVPEQVRRSGRNNKEGVAYSMSQWYPKMAEYDYMGWHADPYVGREFFGVWGDFNVKITIDSAYTLGGTGVVQNPREIGHGYYNGDNDLKRPEGNKLTWEFEAEKVHDFMWAADTNYLHKTREMENGTILHFLYKNEEDLVSKWTELEDYTVQLFEYANEHFGEYPWPQYSVIQGGDGGMEYPMATLITGQRSIGSLVGVTVHEAMHSWYYGLMATNEGLYPWMDEGFTTYTSSRIMSHLFNPEEDSRTGRYYNSYYNLANSDKQEPMSTMGDHFSTNYAYGTSSYGKGAVFVAQLGYILGQEALDRGLLRYFIKWKFKHPSPNDFIRVMEKAGNIHLKWYLSYMLNSTKTIDYGITRVEASNDKTNIRIERIGEFPMPIDLNIEYRDGSDATINIPLRIMRGSKPAESDSSDYRVAEDWPWTNKSYDLTLDRPISEIARITIDSSGRLADIKRENNTIELSEDTEMIIAN